MSWRDLYADRVAWRLCAWFGHRRHYSEGGNFLVQHRHGYGWGWRTRVSCTRCGAEGDAARERGRLEWLQPWRIAMRFRQARSDLRKWLHTDCHDCGKPSIRFGRSVGDHGACIPF